MSIKELAGAERASARRRRWAQESRREAPVRVDAPVRPLVHALEPLLPRWTALAGRRALERDETFRARQAEVDALLRGFAWDLRAADARAPRRPDRLRVACWNIERGKRWDALLGVLREHPALHELDLLMLVEVDLGMGRSGNRDVAKQLAEALGMGYVFAPSHLVLAPGDSAERGHGLPNAQSLHGVALLTRLPVRRVCGVGLPEYADKLAAVERRLGAKRALLAELDAPGGPLSVAVVHLDPFCSPRHRASQIQRVVDTVPQMGSGPVLLGGDLNTNTYDLGGPGRLAYDVLRKLVRQGFAGTVAGYMIPHQLAERSVFDALSEGGLRIDGFVDEAGTLRYDLNDFEYLDKTQRTLPAPVARWLLRRLEAWGATVPMRLDWFAGRGLRPLRAWTVDRPRHRGEHVSDHDPIGVELAWPPDGDGVGDGDHDPGARTG